MHILFWLPLAVPTGRLAGIEISRGLVGTCLVVLGLIALLAFAFVVYSRRRRAFRARCPTCGRPLPRGGPCPYCTPLTGEYTGLGAPAAPRAKPVSPLPPTMPEVAPTVPDVGPTLVPGAADLEPTRLIRRGPQWTLVVKTGPQAGASFPLSGEAIVGRQADCTVRLTDTSVSRRHAQLRLQDEGLIVEDLGSANGTLVNGQLISKPTPLKDGDELTLGETVLTVQKAV